MPSASRRSAINDEEAVRVVALIRPCFHQYIAQYDERKYPPAIYDELLRAFRLPRHVADCDIRKALLWKFGHLGKKRIPTDHEKLISFLQGRWPHMCPALTGSTAEVFIRLEADIGQGKGRYITIAFLLHLLRPAEIPIIDQHNFRAMNHFFRAVRPEWRPRSEKPSTYDDLSTLSSFQNGIRSQWKSLDPLTVPSERSFDRFLMMYGKGLRRAGRSSAKNANVKTIAKGPTESLRGSCVGNLNESSIWLPFGGYTACFDARQLVRYLNDSGRECIVQGQTNCALSAHAKPQISRCLATT